MARNYDVHVRTLAQVPTLVRVDGTWPGPLTLSAGWYRARARPWNELVSEPMIRLDRGGTEFLIGVTRRLRELGASECYSPALYGGSTRVFRRSGFQPHASLRLMERGMRPVTGGSRRHIVRTDPDPDWSEITEVDRSAFEGFWGMSREGLVEALDANRAHALLTTRIESRLAGFAIVGTQWGVAYLHRIAVDPAYGGQGVGRSLVEEAVRWGSAHGGRSIVLNVREDNERAIALYERTGFTDTGADLSVLRLRLR